MKDNGAELIPSIQMEAPTRRIYARLGYSTSRTHIPDHQRATIDATITMAFSLCEIRGALRFIEIAACDGDGVTLHDGTRFGSTKLASIIEGSVSLLLMATTVGDPLVRERDRLMSAGNSAEAVIYDAVGSETADEAVRWLQNYARRRLVREGLTITRQRISPGYGDLLLSEQKKIFDILSLERLNLTLTDHHILIPEKSVTSCAGVLPNRELTTK
jgi:hypothetical protein